MTNQETITNNLIEAILWANYKTFDVSFQGHVLFSTAEAGFDVSLKKYSNFFYNLIEIDTENLPDEKNILNVFNENIALLTEDHFITGSNGVVKTSVQFFSALQLISILKGKKVYMIQKETNNEE